MGVSHLPRNRAAWLLLVLALALAAGTASAAADCGRIVAVGDLHGGYDAFVGLLHRARLVDDELRWRAGDHCLVQLGDLVDRGARSRELLDLLIDLERQAAGRVHVLAGNHEVMTVLGDLRYTDRREFAAFAGDETAEQREEGWGQFSAAKGAAGSDDPALRSAFDAAYPPGWFARREAFSPAGRYGRWILERKLLERIGHTLFVHGGLSPADAETGIDELNASLRPDVERYLDARAALVERGIVEPLASFGDSMAAVELWMQRDKPGGAPEALGLAEQMMELRKSPVSRADGPLWNRDLAEAPESDFAPSLDKILAEVGAARIVVAHTTTPDFRVARRFDDRVFVIDTGAGPAYGGRCTGLEIGTDGGIRALYPDGVVVLVSPESDRSVEDFLTRAEVVASKEIGVGVTRPKKLTLELGGRTRHAAFKTVEIENLGVTRFAKGTAESNFTDDYHYERAAYLLDRELGLHMVPVTVLREVDNEDGAVVDWIEGAFNEHERREQGRAPDDPERFRRQQALMRLFDALLYNVDRNQSNQLFDEDWNLHLIDHTRSFRIKKALPDLFASMQAGLPREMLPRLEALDLPGLQRTMAGLLSKSRIKALLARRDAILAKIERDRELYGDGEVLFDADGVP